MLTDAKLRTLKSADKPYKLSDRDGMYVMVLTTGTISFRYNYRINGRQETLVLGSYGGSGGMTLSEARERLIEAKKGLAAGQSPARQKAREKQRAVAAGTFGEWAEIWLKRHTMAESTRDMRRSVYERELAGKFGRQKMQEVTHEDLRALCDKIVDRGAPATAVHARDIVLMVYRYATSGATIRESGRQGAAIVDREIPAKRPGARAGRDWLDVSISRASFHRADQQNGG